ncbi:DUF4352 domain-containing protein [Micromonospora sp. NPDC048909]|uniref:DUF4352 domain-containing protein n=1 Tax=Micromonospora sp. NPDC048909 TaxID=3155643 RepID=UPI00340D4AF6
MPPTQPWAPQPPMPAAPAESWTPPTAPLPPVSGAPQQPYPTAPYPPVSGVPQPTTPFPTAPNAPQQPYPPVSGVPQQPYPPAPGAAQQPYPGTPYPPVPGAPQQPYPGGSYPPGAPPPGVGYPPGALPAAPAKSRKTLLIVVAAVAVLALLCCVGGIVAVIIGANRAADDVTDALPTPGVTSGVGDRPSSRPSSAAPSTGETRNMAAGETLVIADDDGTMEITVTTFRTSTKACESFALDPEEGMYLIAEVTAVVTKGSGSVNPLFFQWVAADGTETNAIAGAFSGCGKPLPAGNLSVGSERSGTVVFDVPDKDGALEYLHRFEPAGSWRP